MEGTMTPRRFLLLTIALAAASHANPAVAQIVLPTDFANQEVTSGLELPNGMAFLPDGRVLVTEQKTARVRMVVNGHIAATDPVVTVSGVTTSGYERGLQGIAVDPGWPARPYVYVYYTRTGSFCALARYRAQGDLSDPFGENLTLVERLVLIDDIPDNDPNHQAGCLRFGPDGHLFVSLGEDEDPCAAYDSTSLKGQLLRLDVSALPDTFGVPVPRALIIPSGNPLSTADSNARLVWAYGMRNPWRFHIDFNGLIYLADVGEADFEELNEVAAGDYLGWPYREAHRIMPRSGCPEPGGQGAIAYKGPIVAYARPEELTAIISAGVYRPVSGGTNWPAAYWGDAFYGEYYTGTLRRIEKTGDTWAAAAPVPGQPDGIHWGTGLSNMVDFLVGHDGALWWMRQFNDAGDPGSGSLNRIHYTGPDTTSSTHVDLVRVVATPEHVLIEWYVSENGASVAVQRREPHTGW
jgi:glucose/arabinose dehydrogenase